MMKCFFDHHEHYRRRLLAIDSEALLEIRIDANPRAPVHPIALIRAGYKKDQRNSRVFNEVLETIDFVVAAPVGYDQRPALIRNLYEAGLIALWRAVETLWVPGGKNQKRRGCDKCATSRVDMVKFKFDDPL